jgi:hypothetical protein
MKYFKKGKYSSMGVNMAPTFQIKKEKDWEGEEIFKMVQREKKRKIGR